MNDSELCEKWLEALAVEFPTVEFRLSLVDDGSGSPTGRHTTTEAIGSDGPEPTVAERWRLEQRLWRFQKQWMEKNAPHWSELRM